MSMQCPQCGFHHQQGDDGFGMMMIDVDDQDDDAIVCCNCEHRFVPEEWKEPAAMTWTSERPKVPGWYWIRRDGEDDKWIGRVLRGQHSGNLRFLCVSHETDDYGIGYMDVNDASDGVFYYGPIEPPA